MFFKISDIKVKGYGSLRFLELFHFFTRFFLTFVTIGKIEMKVVNNCSKKTRKSRFQKTFFNQKKKSEKVSAKKLDVCGGMWWWWWRFEKESCYFRKRELLFSQL